MADGSLIDMDLLGISLELPSNTPVVMLRERAGLRRHLQIFIGNPEASAIAFALEGQPTPRPMTHDLIKLIIDDVGVTLDRVVVTEVRDTTFFGELHLSAHGDVHVVSCRPSDAIAVAVRVGCPILASATVLEDAGFIDDSVDEVESVDDPDEVVEEFRHFIDTVNPDDFAS